MIKEFDLAKTNKQGTIGKMNLSVRMAEVCDCTVLNVDSPLM